MKETDYRTRTQNEFLVAYQDAVTEASLNLFFQDIAAITPSDKGELVLKRPDFIG